MLSILTAGLWTEFWHLSLAALAIIALLVVAYLAPVGKRYFVEAAVLIAACTAIYTWGIHDADRRCKAQNIAATKVINKVVNKAVKHTRTKKAIAAPDPWNQKDY